MTSTLPRTIAIRDDGQEEAAAVYETDAKGRIKLDEKDQRIVKTPAKLARNAWPADNFVHLKRQLKSGDINMVQKLQVKAQISAAGGKDDAAGLDATIEIFYQPLAYAAVMVKRIEGDWLREQLDEAADLLDDDGTMPDDISDRLKVAEEIPVGVMTFLDSEISERGFGPLDGTAPVKKPSAATSGPKLMKPSKT